MKVLSTKPTEVIKRKVILNGTKDIMFDRYAGDNNTKLEPDQKLYLKPDTTGSPHIILPTANFTSFLSAHNTNSAPKRLRDARKYKGIANACLSFLDIQEEYIPFMRDGEPIRFGRFIDDRDEESGCYVHRSVARLEKGIPNPKVRPVLPKPWTLEFTLILYPNKEIKEQEVFNLISEGGIAIGLGTYRGVFGKFEVIQWE
jgi:hypothetical protein